MKTTENRKAVEEILKDRQLANEVVKATHESNLKNEEARAKDEREQIALNLFEARRRHRQEERGQEETE